MSIFGSDLEISDASYSPEDVAALDHVLEEVCRRAVEYGAVNDRLRRSLAAAILEGVGAGIREHGRLVDFALRALPSFRNS